MCIVSIIYLFEFGMSIIHTRHHWILVSKQSKGQHFVYKYSEWSLTKWYPKANVTRISTKATCSFACVPNFPSTCYNHNHLYKIGTWTLLCWLPMPVNHPATKSVTLTSVWLLCCSRSTPTRSPTVSTLRHNLASYTCICILTCFLRRQ